MINFWTSLSAIRAAQSGLRVAAHNQANLSTPGFHRQSIRFTEQATRRLDGVGQGTGVGIGSISRSTDLFTEWSLSRSVSQQSGATSRLSILTQLEGLVTPGDGSLHARLDDLATQFEQWEVRPAELAQRRAVLTSAQGLTDELNHIANQLELRRRNLTSEIGATVDEVNALLQQTADVNLAIRQEKARGSEPLDLLDRRDALIESLSERLDVRVPLTVGTDDVITLGNGAISFSVEPPVLELTETGNGQVEITARGAIAPLEFTDGRLSGLVTGLNSLLPEMRQRFNAIGRALVRAVDDIQTQSLGLGTGLTRLDSTRPVSHVELPLSEAETAFPVTKGDLYIGITDLATGERRLERITIDPEVESLSDIVAKLDAMPELRAFTQPTDGTLSVVAAPGFSFDFTGQFPRSPAAPGWTGTSQLTLGGQYTGTANQEWTIEVQGSGTVGVTAGLTAIVRDHTGNAMGTVDIGADYAVGDPLEIAQGVTVAFGAGTVVANESVSSAIIGDADTTGVLTGLGLGTFFGGTQPGNLKINPELLADPNRLGSGITGLAGDNSRVTLLSEIRDLRLAELGGQTVRGSLNELTADVGGLTLSTQWAVDSSTAIVERLTVERDSVIGVDLNEELANMLVYQRMFQAASQFLRAADESLQELMSIVR